LTADAISHAAPGNCPNCFAETAGNFCHQCSQETTLHPPSTREFLHEFIGHYVALEGKLWQTMWLLLVKPGRLTLEYIRGRRVRYVQPLRMYLTFSLIFFALMKFSGLNVFESDHGNAAQVAIGVSSPSGASHGERPGAPRDVVQVSDDDRTSMRDAGRMAEKLHAGWGARVDAFLAQPQDAIGRQMSKAFFSYAHYALFALMPVFALLLKLLYLGTGRRYGAHLLFALHANAFAFATLSLQMILPSGWGFVHFALFAWMVAYLPLAMHRVYGSGWAVTLLRWVVLVGLHILCISLAIALMLGSAAVA
jgi:hypothetical protein